MPPPVTGGVAVGIDGAIVGVLFGILLVLVGTGVIVGVGMRVGDPVASPNTCSPLLIIEKLLRNVSGNPLVSTVVAAIVYLPAPKASEYFTNQSPFSSAFVR